MKSRRMTLAVHVVRYQREYNFFRVSIKEPGKNTTSRSIWENDIKMDLKEI
jgi:hypothetical protein